MKTCTKCGIEKPLTEYYKNRANLSAECKTCRNNYTAKWRIDNPESIQAANRKAAISNRTKRTGVTPESYDAMLTTQNNVCAICGEVDHNDRSLAIDHDHTCYHNGQKSCVKCIRGLLCLRCNTGLGSFKDRPTLLQEAIGYLQKWKQDDSTMG